MATSVPCVTAAFYFADETGGSLASRGADGVSVSRILRQLSRLVLHLSPPKGDASLSMDRIPGPDAPPLLALCGA